MKSKLLASFKIWIVIYPSITLLLYVFGDALAAVSLYIRTFIITITLVPWMVFVGLPCINFVMKQWTSMVRKK